MSTSLTRLINLAEVLKEELEQAGQHLPDDLTDEQLQSMTEADVRRHYQADHAQLHVQQNNRMSEQQLQELSAKFPAQNSTPAYKSWFPAMSSSRMQSMIGKQQTAVVLCFHSSGNAEDMYTSEGTGSRRVPSALLDACQAHGWLLLAPQLPGRAQRMKEQMLPSLQAVAQELLPLVAPALLAADGKYAVVGHSLGCWTAVELLWALRQEGLSDPAAMCLSAMPWPHIPADKRPWRQQKLLNEEEFKEECMGWDINQVVFSPGTWELYQPLLRADFRLFDEYEPSITYAEATAAPFSSELRLFWGQRDRRVSQEMVEAWRAYVREPSKLCCTSIASNHLWPVSDPSAKTQWLQEVARVLQGALS